MGSNMQETLLGIEWFGKTIKIAVFSKNKDILQLKTLSFFNIDSLDRQGIIQNLKNWLEINVTNIQKVRTVLSIPESLIFFKNLSLPKVKNKEIESAAFWQVAENSEIKGNEIVFQWKKISEENNQILISAMTIKLSDLESLVSILEEVGIKVGAIEPSSVSLMRIVNIEANKNTLLLMIEENESNLVVIKNQIAVFSSSANLGLVGMKNIHKKLSSDISIALAENSKRIIKFWEEKENSKIHQIIVTGEVAKYYGLASIINNVTKIPVLMAKKDRILYETSKDVADRTINRSLIAIGAALRYKTENTQEINFLPKAKLANLVKEDFRKQLSLKLNSFVKIDLLLLIVLTFILLSFNLVNSSLETNIVETTNLVNNHPAQNLITEINSTNLLLSNYQNIKTSTFDAGKRLQILSSLVPTDINLTLIQLSDSPFNTWKIEGTGNRDNIIAFYKKLQENKFTSVTMPYSNLSKVISNNFIIYIVW